MWESAVTIEPISPELVLVDPLLAARVRSRPEAHRFTPRREPASLELAAAPVRARSRVPPGLVMLAGGLLALIGVTFALSEWPPGVSRPVLSRQSPPMAAVKVIRTTAVLRPFSPPDLAHPAVPFEVTAVHLGSAATEPASDSELRRLVERRVLQQLPGQAGRLVPRSVINRSSGVARNNVRVACRAAHILGRFTCTVFAPSGSRVAALSARVLVRRRIVLGR